MPIIVPNTPENREATSKMPENREATFDTKKCSNFATLRLCGRKHYSKDARDHKGTKVTNIKRSQETLKESQETLKKSQHISRSLLLWHPLLWPASSGQPAQVSFLCSASFGQPPLGSLLRSASSGRPPLVSLLRSASSGQPAWVSLHWGRTATKTSHNFIYI